MSKKRQRSSSEHRTRTSEEDLQAIHNLRRIVRGHQEPVMHSLTVAHLADVLGSGKKQKTSEPARTTSVQDREPDQKQKKRSSKSNKK
jgi:hypothetical protein